MISAKIKLFSLLLFYSTCLCGACKKLQLVYIKDEDRCVPYSGIFDMNASIYSTIEYTTSLQPTLLPASQITVISRDIIGCNIGEDNRGYFLLQALSDMIVYANKSKCFTVFIGPSLGGDCMFISDWMVYTPSTIPVQLRPFQVNYLCPLPGFVKEYVEKSPINSIVVMNEDQENLRYAEVSMTLQVSSVTRVLASILRFQGWRRVMLLHEISAESMSLYRIVDMIVLSFDASGRKGHSANIVVDKEIHLSTNFTILIEPWIRNIDG